MFDEVGNATICVRECRASNAPVAGRRPILFLNDIHDRAYKKWVAAGMPPGDGSRFWLEAEQEIRQGR